MTDEPLRVFKYRRISSDPSGLRFGVQTQNEECDRFIAARGWRLVGEFEDNDASAYNLKKPRPDFDKMLSLAEEGHCDVIIARHVDRLTRRVEQFAPVMRRCTDAGVILVTAADGVDTSTDGGRFVATVLCAVAEMEMERKKYRHTTANVRRARGGKGWGPRAFGYNGDHENPALVPEEEAAIREAYHAILAGATVFSISEAWVRQGLRTGRAGSQFTPVQVKRVLLNPRNAGLRTYQREILYDDGNRPVMGDWPAIIDMDTYEAVRYLLDSRRTAGVPNARKNLLTNLLQCGECGQPLGSGRKSKSQTPNEEDRPNYKCRYSGCRGVLRRVRMVDPWVENAMLNQVRKRGWKLVTDIDPKKIEALHGEATALRTRRDGLGAQVGLGNMTPAQVRVATETIDAKLREIEAELGKVAKSEVFDGLIGAKNMHAVWEGFSLDRKRAVISALTTGITVNKLNVKGWGTRNLPMGTGIKIHWRKAE